MTDREALTDMRAEALDAGGIDVSEARRCAETLRARQAAGYRMCQHHRDVLAACERRVRLAETFATPKKTTA